MFNWSPTSPRNSGTQCGNLLQRDSKTRQGSCELLYPGHERQGSKEWREGGRQERKEREEREGKEIVESIVLFQGMG